MQPSIGYIAEDLVINDGTSIKSTTYFLHLRTGTRSVPTVGVGMATNGNVYVWDYVKRASYFPFFTRARKEKVRKKELLELL